jgi:hypothetical protein
MYDQNILDPPIPDPKKKVSNIRKLRLIIVYNQQGRQQWPWELPAISKQ